MGDDTTLCSDSHHHPLSFSRFSRFASSLQVVNWYLWVMIHGNHCFLKPFMSVYLSIRSIPRTLIPLMMGLKACCSIICLVIRTRTKARTRRITRKTTKARVATTTTTTAAATTRARAGLITTSPLIGIY